MSEKKKAQKFLGRGLDIGTMNIVAASRSESGVVTKRMRDVFLDLPATRTAKNMLKMSGTNFVDRGDEIYILGDAALEVANTFSNEPRRPLSGGLVAAGEMDALEVLGLLIKEVLGEPKIKDEVCCFSIPAAPVNDPTKDIVYHKGIFERIVSECGFNPIASNEAMAIIFAETAQEGFSALSASFGAGMANVALAINTLEAMTFSIQDCGDRIDAGAARSMGSTQARICAIKEKGMDLNNPQGREEEAIAFYYKEMIERVLKHIVAEFHKIRNKFSIPKAIPFVLGGGTSLVGGFLEFFTSVFEQHRKKFPLEISEIRLAKDPLNTVSHGLLIQALQEYQE